MSIAVTATFFLFALVTGLLTLIAVQTRDRIVRGWVRLDDAVVVESKVNTQGQWSFPVIVYEYHSNDIHYVGQDSPLLLLPLTQIQAEQWTTRYEPGDVVTVFVTTDHLTEKRTVMSEFAFWTSVESGGRPYAVLCRCPLIASEVVRYSLLEKSVPSLSVRKKYFSCYPSATALIVMKLRLQCVSYKDPRYWSSVNGPSVADCSIREVDESHVLFVAGTTLLQECVRIGYGVILPICVFTYPAIVYFSAGEYLASFFIGGLLLACPIVFTARHNLSFCPHGRTLLETTVIFYFFHWTRLRPIDRFQSVGYFYQQWQKEYVVILRLMSECRGYTFLRLHGDDGDPSCVDGFVDEFANMTGLKNVGRQPYSRFLWN